MRRCVICAAPAAPDDLIALVEAYSKEQGLFRTDDMPDPAFNTLLELDLSTVEPSLAGPRRPQDRVPLRNMKQSFYTSLKTTFNQDIKPANVPGRGYLRWAGEGGTEVEVEDEPQFQPDPKRHNLYDEDQVTLQFDGVDVSITHGATVIAAITSCTNTSNPSVMVAAGLLAKKASERGLTVPPLCQDQPGAWLARGDRIPEACRPDDVARSAALPCRRLRLHHLYRQQWADRRRDRHGSPGA